jgi:hypothetical protein
MQSHIIRKTTQPFINHTFVLQKNIILTDISLFNNNLGPASLVDTFHRIVSNHTPYFIELGHHSEFEHINTGSFYQYVQNYIHFRNFPINGIFMNNPKTPNKYSCISYNTSLSPFYPQKIENTSISQTNKHFYKIFEMKLTSYKKLYISCADGKCPIIGTFGLKYVVAAIFFHHREFSFDELCLCDTSGDLTYRDFQYLVNSILHSGIPSYKISFQIKNNKYANEIIQYGLQKNITKWDVVADDFAISRGPITYNSFKKWI